MSRAGLPHSKESEMMTLGCMLVSETALNLAADGLDEDDFYFAEHKAVFAVAKRAYAADRPIDVHLACEALKEDGKLESIGGVAYVTRMAQNAGSAAYIEEYIRVVKAKATLRRMLNAAQKVQHWCSATPDDVADTLDRAQNLFFEISQHHRPVAGATIEALIQGDQDTVPFLKKIELRQEKFLNLKEGETIIAGVPTYFTDLDKVIQGLGPSHLIILAARPAMGKTALALNIAENVCFKGNQAVGIFSLEMTSQQLLHRMVSSQAGVENEKIQTGSLSGEEYQRVVAAVHRMQEHLMVIDDQPGLRINDLRARARRMKEAHDIQLLVIDYLQLIAGSGTAKSVENRQNEISEISRMLKTLARELEIPVLCLSQLSRRVEERHGHRPMMSDLRESGCLCGTTSVTTDQGPMSMHALVAMQHYPRVLAWNVEKQALEWDTIENAFSSGIKPTYHLTCAHTTIIATQNHPFWTHQGWTAVEDLEEGTPLFDGAQWWPLLKKRPHTTQEVYDLTISNNHSFIANHLVVHNSIEQDADIVSFILRRDYYDPHDKPGLAEIIIAKNRHGPTGSVELTFRKEVSQFANYAKHEAQEDPIQGGDFNDFLPSS